MMLQERYSFTYCFQSDRYQLFPSPYLFCNFKQQVKESAKLRQIMQTILTLGNALNQGTARGRYLTLVAILIYIILLNMFLTM